MAEILLILWVKKIAMEIHFECVKCYDSLIYTSLPIMGRSISIIVKPASFTKGKHPCVETLNVWFDHETEWVGTLSVQRSYLCETHYPFRPHCHVYYQSTSHFSMWRPRTLKECIYNTLVSLLFFREHFMLPDS